MIYREDFCKNIKNLRISNNLSKKDMAQRLGISIRTLNIIESGELPKRLPTKIIFIIVDNFNVRAEDLFK